MGEFNFGGEIQRTSAEYDAKMKKERDGAAGRSGGVGQARPERREMPAFTPEMIEAANKADVAAGQAAGTGQARPERRTMPAMDENSLANLRTADQSAGKAAGVGKPSQREMPRVEL